jgi:signal transduction histidine kinase
VLSAARRVRGILLAHDRIMSWGAPSEANSRLAAGISSQRREIEEAWLARIQKDVVKTPGVELTTLRNAMPDYLKALVTLLASPQDATLDLTGRQAWADVAREHGITRVRIGFDISQLVHEFIVLRQVIRELAVEPGPHRGEQEAALADLLDAAVVAALEAYVDARDYETRRAQAHNIAFLTHELRNPLSNATMAAGELKNHVAEKASRAMVVLERALARLTEMIDGVLLTQKFEAGKVEPHLADTTLGDIVEPALESARSVAARKGIAFQVSYDPAQAMRADRHLLSSAIENLADNAVKYTDSGRVQVAIDRKPGATVFHVRDTCHGLSPEELRTIFEPFRRGKTAKGGTGLGLAIARRAVEAHGGTIEAESPGPAGCHFWITLPDRPD